MSRALVIAVALTLSRGAGAADFYPVLPDEMDRFCQVIGEAPDASVPPKDRLWFQESCHCATGAGCGRLGSERFWKRREAWYDAQKRKADEEAAAKARTQGSVPSRPVR
jgi:hypothetical protein